MNTAENKKILARNILYYMDMKGVTNQQLCSDLNFKYSTFMEWIKARAYPRIGAVEKLAHYFGCEKSDLIEDRQGKPAGGDGLSEKRQALIQFAHIVPEDKVDMVLRVARIVAEDD